jgi:hypothetical protein
MIIDELNWAFGVFLMIEMENVKVEQIFPNVLDMMDNPSNNVAIVMMFFVDEKLW